MRARTGPVAAGGRGGGRPCDRARTTSPARSSPPGAAPARIQAALAAGRPARPVAVAAAAPAAHTSTLDLLLAARPSTPLTLADVLPLAHAAPADLAAAACAARGSDPAFRARGPGGVATFSPKAFLPLTRLCGDACGYCAFVKDPAPGRRAFMTADECVDIAAAAAAAGCTEALLTCGDAPERVHPSAAAELARLGYADTPSYAAAVAGAVAASTGLLVHSNVGLVSPRQAAQLKKTTASQGLMLETVSASARSPGGPHDAATCPDKEPGVRLAALASLAAARVPTTSGLLLGIGETRAETLAALLALRRLNQASAASAGGRGSPGFLQEVILQPLLPKAGTRMGGAAPPSLEDLAWAVSAARLVMGHGVAVQAPPNLAALLEGDRDAAAAAAALLRAGACDFGGISPVTADHISPEAPWPPLAALADGAAAAGLTLAPRLPVYPPFFLRDGGGEDGGGWLDGSAGPASPRAAVLRAADGVGLARGGAWRPGGRGGAWTGGGGPDAVVLPAAPARPPPPAPALPAPAPYARTPRWRVALTAAGELAGCEKKDRAALSPGVARILGRLADADWPAVARPDPATGAPPPWGPRGPPHRAALTTAEAAALLAARGPDLDAVLASADALRARVFGPDAHTATFVVNRNINYTNVCGKFCDFCAFSAAAPEGGRGGSLPSASGGAPVTSRAAEAPYFWSEDAVAAAAAEAWDAGATEVCMQGGIAPALEREGVAAYARLVAAAKAGAPAIHVHALSPLEVWTAARGAEAALPSVLARLRDAGLGSLPGTAAEVLVPAVRASLCPGKISARQWLRVMRAAHGAGLRSTATLMFGAGPDSPAEWARHFAALRSLQSRTWGFTEFVALPFVPDLAPGYAAGRRRSGPTRRDVLAVTAVARLFFLGSIDHIQASWPKCGLDALPDLLRAGADDLGGVLMRESISRAAGAAHGAGVPPSALAAAARAAGRVPVVRTTLYGRASPDRVAAAFGAEEAAVERVC